MHKRKPPSAFLTQKTISRFEIPKGFAASSVRLLNLTLAVVVSFDLTDRVEDGNGVLSWPMTHREIFSLVSHQGGQ